MARVCRGDVISPDEIAVVHVMNRVVRRCFLMGKDSITGKDYSHRKTWIEEQFSRLAQYFGIDMLSFAVLCNHFHQVLRSRPDIVRSWSRHEVARRWLMLCPKRKHKDGSPREPKKSELNEIINNDIKFKEIRTRLSDISWWMRLLCQRIAQRCNAEDEMKGKFWESRFRCVRLLDEEAILACSAYVDLNPIRAAIAESLEESHHTSIQLRLQEMLANLEATAARVDATQSCNPEDTLITAATARAEHVELSRPATDETMGLIAAVGCLPVPSAPRESAHSDPQALAPNECRPQPYACEFLSPFEIDERAMPGPMPSGNGRRASDKGFLSMPLTKYVALLDWTARKIVAERKGLNFEELPPVFARMKLNADVWYKLVTGFGELFSLVAGRPQKVDTLKGRVNGKRFYMPAATRELLKT